MTKILELILIEEIHTWRQGIKFLIKFNIFVIKINKYKFKSYLKDEIKKHMMILIKQQNWILTIVNIIIVKDQHIRSDFNIKFIIKKKINDKNYK